MNRFSDTSPSGTARLAGVFYLISIVTRIIADAFVRDRLVNNSDAGATAANILAHESLFRLGFVADIAAFASYAALAALLYELFKPVSRSLSLAAAFFGLFSAISQGISSVFHLAAQVVLGQPEYLRAFPAAQLQAFALFLLKLRAITYHNVGLVFLGLYCIMLGALILRSSFLPRAIGVLVALAGVAYLPFLWPPMARALLPYLLIPAAIGQFAITLWLLVAGVNSNRWKEQAGVTPAPFNDPSATAMAF